MTKNIIIAIVVILLVVGGYFLLKGPSVEPEPTPLPPAETPEVPVGQLPTTPTPPVDKTKTVLGQSVEGRDIVAYHYGEGAKELLLVGGIHGGYEWNTSALAYEVMDYLAANPTAVPAGLKVSVIPALNPDGLFKTVGTTERFTKEQVPAGQDATVPGRFNANKVDLNRNFDCDWQAEGKWQNKVVSGGTAAFSEPESLAIKNYVEASKPAAVVVYYSAAGGVFASNCHGGVLPETLALTNEYAKASGYPAYREFNFYEITGDMVNWLAKMNIPAISVLLTNHTDTEFSKNKLGLEALFTRLATPATTTNQ